VHLFAFGHSKSRVFEAKNSVEGEMAARLCKKITYVINAVISGGPPLNTVVPHKPSF
jgi:hypothetical protein